MKILERNSASRNSNSVLYLALLCLLYLLVTSNYLPPSFSSRNSDTTDDKIFIEISKDGIASVKSFENTQVLLELKSKYGLQQDLISGDRITINGNEVRVSKLSARKRISLGVPIGINSATAEDLTAIQGIGQELAKRIIDYRKSIGEFQNIDELDNIEGIGKKKLAIIKTVGNLN